MNETLPCAGVDYFKMKRGGCRIRKPPMQKVDLALAVNYLPACNCLVKLLVFTAVLSVIPEGEEVLGGYLVLAALLYLDRMVTKNIIFDANAILIAVFFANVHAVIRASGVGMRPHPVFMWFLHLVWFVACVVLVIDPPPVRQLFERRAQANRLAPVVLMLVVIVVTSYFQGDLEPASLRVGRALAFTLLSFAWIYVVGIHSQQGIEYLKESSCQFVSRLAPVLYSPVWLSVLFCPAIVWALVVQHVARQNLTRCFTPPPHTYAPLLPVTSSDLHGSEHTTEPTPPSTAESHPLPANEPDSQLEELFRQAKQASASQKPRTM